MSKFRINDTVIDKDGRIGTIRAREVKSFTKPYNDGIKPHTEVKYMVDFGNGIDNWKVMSRKELGLIVQAKVVPEVFRVKYVEDKFRDLHGEKVPTINHEPFLVKEYALKDGRGIIMAAMVEVDLYGIGVKTLSIGYSIYNGKDEYDDKIGIKIACHRTETDPFVLMTSATRHEFSRATVCAIMDVKADYIADNISRFCTEE